MQHNKIFIKFLFVILLLNTDKVYSQLDLSFNSPVLQEGDSSRFDGKVKAITRQKDGKYLIGGEFRSYNGRNRKNFCRLLANGNLDDNFISTSGFDKEVNCIAVQGDGKILVGGEFNTYNSQSASKIIRLNNDGSVDNSFVTGTGFHAYAGGIYTIVIQPSGKILIGGNFKGYNGVEVYDLVRLNEDGTIDYKFNAGLNGSGEVHSIALQKNKILVAGSIDIRDSKSHSLFRFNDNGGQDIGFNVGGEGFKANSEITKILVQPDNKIICFGKFFEYNGNEYQGRIIRLGENGWIDKKFKLGTGFGTFSPNDVYDALLDDEGNIYVAGRFKVFNNNTRVGLLRLLPDGTLDNNHVNENIYNGVIVHSLYKNTDGSIMVGGDFKILGNFSRNGIALLDKNGKVIQNVFNMYRGFDAATKIIIPFKENKYLVAGDFKTYNSLYVDGMMSIDEYGNIDNSFQFPSNLYEIRNINDIKIQNDGKILLAGFFRNKTDRQDYSLIRLHPNGKPDDQFFTGGGFVDDFGAKKMLRTIEIQPNGKILAGGYFEKYDGISVNGIVRLNENGSLDNSFKTDFPTETKKIILDNSGNILVLGKAISKTNVEFGLLRYNSTGSLDTKFDIRSYSKVDFNTGVIQADGKIVLGGIFITSDNKYYEGLLRINNDGTIDKTFKLDSRISECGNNINQISILPDNTFLVGFTSRDEQTPRTNYMFGLIKVASDGMLKGFPFTKGFATATNSSGDIVGSFVHTKNNKIIVAGSFAKVDDYNIWNLAKLNNEVIVSVEKTATTNQKTTSASKSTTATKETSDNPSKSELDFLYAYKGKDPIKSKVLEHIKLKTRINQLIKKIGEPYSLAHITKGDCAEVLPIVVKEKYAKINLIGGCNSKGNPQYTISFIIDIPNNNIFYLVGNRWAEDKESDNNGYWSITAEKKSSDTQSVLNFFNLKINE